MTKSIQKAQVNDIAIKGKVEYSTHREAYGVYLELDDVIKLNKIKKIVGCYIMNTLPED